MNASQESNQDVTISAPQVWELGSSIHIGVYPCYVVIGGVSEEAYAMQYDRDGEDTLRIISDRDTIWDHLARKMSDAAAADVVDLAIELMLEFADLKHRYAELVDHVAKLSVTVLKKQELDNVVLSTEENAIWNHINRWLKEEEDRDQSRSDSSGGGDDEPEGTDDE